MHVGTSRSRATVFVSQPFDLLEDPYHRVGVELAVFQHCLAKPVFLDAIFHADEPSPSDHYPVDIGADPDIPVSEGRCCTNRPEGELPLSPTCSSITNDLSRAES